MNRDNNNNTVKPALDSTGIERQVVYKEITFFVLLSAINSFIGVKICKM